MHKMMKYSDVEYRPNDDKIFKPWVGGFCKPPWYPLFGKCKVRIKEKYKNDIGLLYHELKHVEQYRRDFFNNILYTCSKKYRYRMELEAYTEQIRVYKYTKLWQAQWIIDALVNKYNVGIDKITVTKDVATAIESVNKDEV